MFRFICCLLNELHELQRERLSSCEELVLVKSHKKLNTKLIIVMATRIYPDRRLLINKYECSMNTSTTVHLQFVIHVMFNSWWSLWKMICKTGIINIVLKIIHILTNKSTQGKPIMVTNDSQKLLHTAKVPRCPLENMITWKVKEKKRKYLKNIEYSYINPPPWSDILYLYIFGVWLRYERCIHPHIRIY